jgi:phosphoglucosamine mutase
MQLFGTSGVRRLVDSDLINLGQKIGLAVGTIYKKIVVGRDTRTSGSALRQALTSGLLATGAECSDAGILPTPGVALAAREFSAGIMITASHNPPQYNGYKLLNPDGSAFSPDQQKQIEDLIENPGKIDLRWEKMRTETLYEGGVEKHISRILLDFPGIYKLKVVVDSGCGAAYFITANLLMRMGCQVISLNGFANGIFPHDIEPIESNLGDLISAVKESRADLGIAHDGDADRMMAVDDKGRFISGDKMLAILARANRSKDIVTTIDASMAIEEMDFKVRRTRVGDPYVSEELKKGGGFGGEPSGAWVFPQISLCPDGIYAAAQIVAIAQRERLSELVDSIPEYPTVRGNLKLSKIDMNLISSALISEFKPVSFDKIDGVRLRFEDGWLLVRPSGTEPKLRFTAEAKQSARAHQIYEEGIKIITDHYSGS